MTFNVLSDPPGGLCNLTNKQNMQAIVNFIKNNGISVAALQEVVKQKDSDACDFDHIQYLKDAVALIAPGYTVTEREYIHAQQGSREMWWYRVFLHNTPIIPPIVSTSTAASNSQGAEAIVVDTPVGRIRFINLHPQPGTQALTLDTHLLPFIDQFRSDGIPMVIMGDFNLRYDFADAAPVLKRIEDAGFYRACDPVKFPNGNCNDTVRDPNSNFAVDYIFIDKRATFSVRNAYVEQSLQFSDHLPVVVELSSQPANTPPVGYLDSASCTSFSGWTCDADKFSQTLKVQFYDGSTYIGETTANQTRVDLEPLCGGTNNHGYTYTTPSSLKDGKSHSISAFAINILPDGTVGGSNVLLTSSPKTFTCAAPTAIPTSTPIPTPTIIPIPGDNNPKDGKISTTELYAILRSYYTNTPSLDTNGDGRINSMDYIFVRPYIR